MSRENEITLKAYNTNMQQYIDGTPHDVPEAVKRWINASVSGLSKDAKILEIGSSFGRDAAYIENTFGYQVECSDAAEAFVNYLRNKGRAAIRLDIVRDILKKQYDLIFANAVLLHLTREEAKIACINAHRALSAEGGRLSLSLICGDGDLMTNAASDKTGASRYFCYWQPTQLDAMLKAAGFRAIDISSRYELDTNTTWLLVIAKK